MTTPVDLVLDCSFAGVTIGLKKHNDSVIYEEFSAVARSSDRLHVMLRDVVARSSVKYEDIQTIGVTVGPGSFTGCRIGLAVAEAWRLVHPHVQIVGLGTLAVIAKEAIEKHDIKTLFVVLSDAAGNDIYAQTFDASGAPATPPTCLPNMLLEAATSAVLAPKCGAKESPQGAQTAPVAAPAAPIAALLPPLRVAAGLPLIEAAFHVDSVGAHALFLALDDPRCHLSAVPLYVKALTYRHAM